MSAKRSELSRKLLPPLAVVLTALVLLSLALPSVGTLASSSPDDDDKPSAERRGEM